MFRNPRVHLQEDGCVYRYGTPLCMYNTVEHTVPVYKVSQEECARLREGVPYVKVYRYNPKHLCPKLNGYGDNGERKCGLLAGPHTVPVS